MSSPAEVFRVALEHRGISVDREGTFDPGTETTPAIVSDYGFFGMHGIDIDIIADAAAEARVSIGLPSEAVQIVNTLEDEG